MKKNEVKKNVAEIVTQRFIEALSLGNVPWFRPWELWSSWSRLTGNDYQGANLLTLSGGEYVTFKQAKEQGIKINKGAKSEMIVKYTDYMQKISADKLEEHAKTIAYYENQGKVEHLEDGSVKIPAKSIRYYNVFNVETCTNAEVKHEHKQPKHEWQPVDKAEAIAEAYRAMYKITLEHCGNEAYNRDSLLEGGHVQLPKREQFERVEEYYSTLFHELIHSTADHVKRDKSKYHADKKARAREELVAEIGAAYILSFLGMETNYSVANSQAYVGNWAKRLESDPNAILWATPKAIEAAELIFKAAGIDPNAEETSEESSEPAHVPQIFTIRGEIFPACPAPAEAQAEFNAKAIAKAKAGKLTKANYKIVKSCKGNKITEEVSGYVTIIDGEAVGVQKNLSLWVVTDLKSGLGLTRPENTRAKALKEAEETITAFCEKLDSIRTDFISKNVELLKAA